MTAPQRDAIVNPAVGLIVFVTNDNSFYYQSGSGWISLSGGNLITAGRWLVQAPMFSKFF